MPCPLHWAVGRGRHLNFFIIPSMALRFHLHCVLLVLEAAQRGDPWHLVATDTPTSPAWVWLRPKLETQVPASHWAFAVRRLTPEPGTLNLRAPTLHITQDHHHQLPHPRDLPTLLSLLDLRSLTLLSFETGSL